MGRVYDPAGTHDGTRILVDRLWPRGLAKDRAEIDEWCRVVAPSTELRKWYGHDPGRFVDFSVRYRAELSEPERAAVVEQLKAIAARGVLTLLTASKDITRSQVAVLAQVLVSNGQGSSATIL